MTNKWVKCKTNKNLTKKNQKTECSPTLKPCQLLTERNIWYCHSGKQYGSTYGLYIPKLATPNESLHKEILTALFVLVISGMILFSEKEEETTFLQHSWLEPESCTCQSTILLKRSSCASELFCWPLTQSFMHKECTLCWWSYKSKAGSSKKNHIIIKYGRHSEPYQNSYLYTKTVTWMAIEFKTKN